MHAVRFHNNAAHSRRIQRMRRDAANSSSDRPSGIPSPMVAVGPGAMRQLSVCVSLGSVSRMNAARLPGTRAGRTNPPPGPSSSPSPALALFHSPDLAGSPPAAWKARWLRERRRYLCRPRRSPVSRCFLPSAFPCMLPRALSIDTPPATPLHGSAADEHDRSRAPASASFACHHCKQLAARTSGARSLDPRA